MRMGSERDVFATSTTEPRYDVNYITPHGEFIQCAAVDDDDTDATDADDDADGEPCMCDTESDSVVYTQI